MMNLLKHALRHGILGLLAAPILVVALGCQNEPERTEDPAEIEKIRQEHIDRAEREMRESS